jgi:hypothetical protein
MPQFDFLVGSSVDCSQIDWRQVLLAYNVRHNHKDDLIIADGVVP